jgi:hypothetical protein
MQPIDYPPTGSGGQAIKKVKLGRRTIARVVHKIGYGDFLRISFTQGAYLTNNNPNAFVGGLPTGYFSYDKKCKGTVVITGPAANTPQTVNITFDDGSGNLYIFALSVVDPSQVTQQSC